MKNKIFLIIFSFHLLSINILADNTDTTQTTDSIQHQDTTYTEKNQLICNLEKRIEILENDLIDYKKSDNSFLISYASYLVAVLSFLLAVTLVWLGYLNKKKINEEIIELDKIKNDIEEKLKSFKSISEKIIEIDKRITSTQTFIQQGLESNFNLFYRYLTRKSKSDFLNLLFEKRAILNLYSPDKEARFAGITTLKEKGKRASISHLEKIIFNPDETDNNKRLATDAIVNINSRINKPD